MSAASEFRLFPEERHFWSFNDYRAVVDVVRKLGARRVLEFGPGSSTLALIEGGADKIDCCEDDPAWFTVYKERLQDVYPDIVTLHPYHWQDPLRVAGITGRWYDLALIDGPFGTPHRPAAIEYALQRSFAVLAPTEEWRDGRAEPELGLRSEIARIAQRHNHKVEIMETGPLSGAFALIT